MIPRQRLSGWVKYFWLGDLLLEFNFLLRFVCYCFSFSVDFFLLVSFLLWFFFFFFFSFLEFSFLVALGTINFSVLEFLLWIASKISTSESSGIFSDIYRCSSFPFISRCCFLSYLDKVLEMIPSVKVVLETSVKVVAVLSISKTVALISY